MIVKDKSFLEKYNEIRKVSKSIKNNLKMKLYIIKDLKIKIKSYKGKINTKEGSQQIYISVILIDSVYRKFKKSIILKYFFLNINMLLDSGDKNCNDSDEEN